MVTANEDVKSINFTFSKAMRVISYQRDGRIEDIMEELGLSYNDSLIFLKEIYKSRWAANNSRSSERDDLTVQEKIDISEKSRHFDYLLDFDSYYTDFIRFYNIDLIENDIPYIKFEWLLQGIINNDKSDLTNRLKYRSYTKSKEDSTEYARYMASKKDLYSLHNEEQVDAIWSRFKRVGGK